MADDNDQSAPDPWADLSSSDGPDAADAAEFSFDALESLEPFVTDEDPAPEAAIDRDATAEFLTEPVEPVAGREEQSEPIGDDIATWLAEPVAPSSAVNSAIDGEDHQPAPSLLDSSSIQIGTGESGVVAEREGFDVADAALVDEHRNDDNAWPVAEAWPVESEDLTIEPSFGGFDAADAGALAGAAAIAITGGSQAAGAASSGAGSSRTSRSAARKKSGSGAVGAVVGGLLSIPIVLAILLGVLWGTGRDLLGFRSWMPAFLVPAAGRAAARDVAEAPGPRIDEAPSLDAVTRTQRPAEEPAADEPTPTDEPVPVDAAVSAAPGSVRAVVDAESPAGDEPATPSADLVAEKPAPMLDDIPAVKVENPLLAAAPVAAAIDPFAAPASSQPAVPPPIPEPSEPPPLDLSGLEAAAEDAMASTEAVLSAGSDAPDRRKLLVAWYKDLARVGEELTMLETVAADSGRPLSEIPAPLLDLYGTLADADAVHADLKRLCRNWVDFAKRPADGVMLVGDFESTRQVGPYWHTALAIEQADGSMRRVTVISRREPQADPGDHVVAAGVVFSGDVVWAADCGRLDRPVAEPEGASF